MRHLTPLTVALTLTACAQPQRTAEPTLDDLPRLAVESDLRLGSFDDPDLGFTRVSALDVDRDGRIYAFEYNEQEIRVFSPEGELLHTIGGEGEGPGEFRSAGAFGVEGDTVWAIDSRMDRITLFRRDGTLLSSRRFEPVRIPTPGGMGHVGPTGMRPDGLFFSHLNRRTYLRDGTNEDVEPGDSIPVPRVLFDATGAVVDTVGWDPRPNPRLVVPPDIPTSEYRSVTVGSDRYRVPTPPSQVPRWEELHDGKLILDIPHPESADSATFTLTRVGLSWDTVYHRVFHYRPTPYTTADLDAIAAAGARRGSNAFIGGVPVTPSQDDAQVEAATARLREEMDFPDYRPAFSYSWVAQDGGVWLRRREAEANPDAQAASRWIVLDDEGRPLGEVELPPGTRPLWSDGDTFWVSEPDEFEVPWLVRYRIAGDG